MCWWCPCESVSTTKITGTSFVLDGFSVRCVCHRQLLIMFLPCSSDLVHIPDEIQSHIVSLLTVGSWVSPDDRSWHPSKFATVQKLWARSIQSVTYQECHLVCESSSHSFFNSILSPCLGAPGPGCFVVVFCVSVDLGYNKDWWALFKGALPDMNNLVTFCFEFTHKHMDSIELYADAAQTNLFPPVLENVIIRLLECEYVQVSIRCLLCVDFNTGIWQALLLAPPWDHPSFTGHLSWRNNVGSIVIETPAFVIWPPTLTQFHKFKDDVIPWFIDCRFDRILIMCAYGMELSQWLWH